MKQREKFSIPSDEQKKSFSNIIHLYYHTKQLLGTVQSMSNKAVSFNPHYFSLGNARKLANVLDSLMTLLTGDYGFEKYGVHLEEEPNRIWLEEFEKIQKELYHICYHSYNLIISSINKTYSNYISKYSITHILSVLSDQEKTAFNQYDHFIKQLEDLKKESARIQEDCTKGEDLIYRYETLTTNLFTINQSIQSHHDLLEKIKKEQPFPTEKIINKITQTGKTQKKRWIWGIVVAIALFLLGLACRHLLNF
ncbi:MAG: YiiG family protein [Myxococcales bacterium]|nr:YiiG family protein [Myxococcales bacterium]